MLPKSINPINLLDGLLLKPFSTGLSGFPDLFSNLFRSILGNQSLLNHQINNPFEQQRPSVYLGAITDNNPTVFNLLGTHPKFGKDRSNILNASSNQNKSFKKIPSGSYVYLNPQTSEISWSMTPPRADQLPKGRPYASSADPLSQKLANAVESYVGKTYEEVDCYELVVHGIKDMGYRYYGAGGIKEQLVQMAVRTGKNPNAYLTGEGLVQATGDFIYSRSLPPHGDYRSTAQHIFEEIKPNLNKGYILSFSTQTRGHTGIISHREGQWTFINSGSMDHNLIENQNIKGVGEETLQAEIENWLKRASRRNENLQITVGRLDHRKIAAFYNPGTFIEQTA